jgi:hypothetical protein
MMKLKLSSIYQVHYKRLFSQMHQHDNYLELILIRNYLQKLLKSQAASLGLGRSRFLQLKPVDSKEMSGELLIKVRECFVRVNICNQSKPLDDTSKCVSDIVYHPSLTLPTLLWCP